MTAQGWLQIAVYLAVLTALTPLLGGYMARVYQGEPLLLDRLLGPVERLLCSSSASSSVRTRTATTTTRSWTHRCRCASTDPG